MKPSVTEVRTTSARRALASAEMAPLLRFVARRPTIAIDLGTAFVRVGTPSEPLAVERPTTADRGGPPAMHGGVVHDIDAAAEVLASALRDIRVRGTARARVLVSVPATATPVEREGVRWALQAAGARSDIELIEEPLAAAIGLGLDIADERPHLVVDVGHGISEAAVIAAGHLREVRGVRLGCAQLQDPATSDGVLDLLGRMVASMLSDLHPDEAASIDEVHLVGGGSLLPAVHDRIAEATALPIRLADHRLHAVAHGDAVCALETFRTRSARR